MSEAGTMLRQKTSELATAIDEARSELARLDEGQRSDAHRQLIALCKEAADWLDRLEASPEAPSGEAAASLAQKAEQYLLKFRTRRDAV